MLNITINEFLQISSSSLSVNDKRVPVHLPERILPRIEYIVILLHTLSVFVCERRSNNIGWRCETIRNPNCFLCNSLALLNNTPLDKFSSLFISLILFVQAFISPKSTTAFYNSSGMLMQALANSTIQGLDVIQFAYISDAFTI
jgi:hypothetical protein